MTVYDGVMALIVLYTLVHGYFRGAAWQIAPILSLVMGYLVAMPMSVTTAHYFGPPPLNRLFSLVTIYILVSMFVYLMVRSFREGVEKAKLTEFDRHSGSNPGWVQGDPADFGSDLHVADLFSADAQIILKSESSSIAARLISQIYPILPKAMHTILDPYLKQLDQQLPIDLNTNDGFQGGGTPARSVPAPASPAPTTPSWLPQLPGSGSASEFRLDPTTAADAPEYRPAARRQIRSAPQLLDSAPAEPQPRRAPMKSAQEDDPFEAADPDRAISPPR